MGKLTLSTETAHTAGSNDEAYHEALFAAHGSGAHARAGDPELFGVSPARTDAGEQWWLGELATSDGVGIGDQAG